MTESTRRMSALANLAVSLSDASESGIELQQRHPLAMFNLRGPADAAFRNAVRAVCGCELPTASNSSSAGPDGEILKLGPDEWLLVSDTGALWSETMAIPGATLTDVSHGRIAVRLTGEKSRDVLAKGCSVDLHPGQFPPGTCIQTSISKISVIIHRPQNDHGFMLYAARSYAGSFWHWLTAAANEYGYRALTQQFNNDKIYRQPGEP